MKNSSTLNLGAVAAAVACVALPTQAAEWDTSASVTPGLIYTDNVCLSADNTQDEWIGKVTPAGSVSANGANANLNIRGAVEFNTLSNSRLENLGCNGGSVGNRDQFAPRLNGNADAVLVENWFYIDGRVNAYQNDITPYANGGGDSLNTTGNTNTTYNYSVSPYVSRRFKDQAQVNLRYTWDDQYNTANVVGDNTKESANFLLQSVPGVANLSWGLQGDYSNVSYSDAPAAATNKDSELKSAQLNLGYQLTRVWQVNGYYGQEWNDFVSSQDKIDGTFWDTGVRWTPNSRTVVDAGIGDRFFGSAPRFSVTHSHKRSTFDASYAKTLTYDRDIRGLSDPSQPGGELPPGFDPGQTTITTSPILDERYTLGYAYQGNHTGFRVNAYQSDQTKQGASSQLIFTESTYHGISVTGNRSLSQNLSILAGAFWNEQEPKNGAVGALRKSEQWRGMLGVQRQMSQSTNLGLNYQYTDRKSDNAFDEYTENRITLNLRIDL